MIYHDILGKAYHRTFIVVVDLDGLIADGIYEDYRTAAGQVITSIWEFQESYQEEGDEFEIGQIQYGENSDSITIKYKSHYWSKPCETTYYILYNDGERMPEHDRPKKPKKEKS